LKEYRGPTVELGEFGRIDFGHLKDGDANTNDKECHDDSDDLCGGGLEPLE
jgi:hypothetical protein